MPQLSPFRYPGGKTWLVPFVTRWIRSLSHRPSYLVDPFVGGGSIPLAALSQGLVDRLILRELDRDVAAVWQCVFSNSYEDLCKRILAFRISRTSVINELQRDDGTIADRAFRTILKNRTFRGGILAKGASLMKAGENGHGIKSRWYPDTLVRRIRGLAQFRNAVDFSSGDGFEVIRSLCDDSRATFFIDPPYTAGTGKRAGMRLYRHSQIDHEELFGLMARSAGSFLMTYDDDLSVTELTRRFGFQIQRVPMKNTHHEKKCELVITRR